MQTTGIEQRYASPRGLAELWAGVLLGPLSWSMHLWVSYFLAGVLCDSRGNLTLLAASAVFLGIAVAGAWIAWRNYNLAGRRWPRGDADGILIRSRFLAVAGLLLALLSVLLILAQTIPMLMLRPCN
jgi:hypothetical protein